MHVQMHRFLPLLFFFSWPLIFLRDNHPPVHHASDLHPIVLLPGHTCSQLRAQLTYEYDETSAAPSCGARKGKGWFRLWENYTALQDPALVPCYAEQLRLVFDPVAGDYRNVKGVDTRVVSFGTTSGFGSDDPAQKNHCMRKLVGALKGVGYKEGQNLFGAPYDFRYAPAPLGQDARQFSYFVSSLRVLIERATETNGNKPVILVTHSYGGLTAMNFLNENALWWRERYIKHFIMVSTGAGGIVAPLRNLASGISYCQSSRVDVLSFKNTSRSFASVFSALPSPKVFGNTPLVITQAKNYSAYDIPEFLAAIGFSADEVARYKTRALPVTLNFRAPGVPMTCINGVGVPTVEKLVYRYGSLHSEPEVVYGDGDGAVNMVSIQALDTVIGDDPDQDYYKSVLIPNATHAGILSDAFAVDRVVSEILEASRAIY
ncbi:lecithin-cholesterol acyltransferase-like 1 [Phragmites australis]|uniref:lecithin-cholesterol acyltransferase-like 1 n=1 Tax=Phragmites australis TaxID=29695 RepID=UPI002D79BF2A|nr:lecithin-cholesterol acyltransferase-like 1 [Phragmites australis]